MSDLIRTIVRQVVDGIPVTRFQAEQLVRIERRGLPELFAGASQIRQQYLGPKVRCCSIVASKVGLCDQDCAFCSQSAHYRTHVTGGATLASQDVLAASREAADNGAQSFGIVNSGLGPGDDEIEEWSDVIRAIRREGRVRACASLGVLTAPQAERLAEAGVQRYNHNLQTSRQYFPNIVTTHTYDDRLETLRKLRAAGIELCCGALFGMGETWDDRLDLAFELREVNPEVVPINFLIPIAGTPLEHSRALEAIECLRIIAVYRFILPSQHLNIAGGREVNLRDLQSWMFLAGADSFMMGNYLTTCGRSAEEDLRMIHDLGLELEPYLAPAAVSDEAQRSHIAV
ncbi:MAG: biotin synthase BioB [Phycisphaerae bacterium]